MERLLRGAYRVNADRPALTDARRTVTFAQVETEVDEVIRGLAALGASPGDCVAIICSGRIEAAVLDQAAYLGGFIRLAVNRRLHPREAVEILRRARAKVVVVDKEWATRIESELDKTRVEHLILLDGGAEPGGRAVAYEQVRVGGRRWIGAVPQPVSELAPAQLGFTSGTTGSPKGAVHSLRAIAASLRNTIMECDARHTDVVHTAMPLSHVGGILTMAYFVRGAHQFLAEKFDTGSTVDAVRTHGATVLFVVPAMLTELNPLMVGVESKLRRIIYGGSPMPVSEIVRTRAVFGSVLLQMYGQTESGLPISTLGPEDHDWDGEPPPHLASVGRPTPYADVRVVRTDGTAADIGELGEVTVRSDSVMTEYFEDPEATAAALSGGWLRTGDIGRFDLDGRLYLVGRSKEVIISGGFNVYPAEVEDVIMSIEDVREVAVLGTPHPKWGETVAAVVVSRSGKPLDPVGIERLCREHLAGFKIPRVITQVTELPRNSGGKVMKKELARLLTAEEEVAER
ncbi:class I adenylate-forming enzyme family protein [Microbacterium suaedae]|nr:AMP-binding protein [Microbacterium suaedae]